MGRKEDLKVLFETGKIPFGEDFATFIDESFNNYKVVDMFNPNIAPNSFDEGENVLVFKYDPVTNPDWAALFGPLVGPGDVMVRTLAYPNANIWLQEFDTDRNGRYYANYSRGSTDGVTWSGLINHPRVDTVNGVGPDVNGNIQLTIPPSGVGGEKPVVTYYKSDYPTEKPNTNDFLVEFNIPDYDEEKDLLLFFRGEGQFAPIEFGAMTVNSYTNGVLELTLANSGYTATPIALYRFTYSGGLPGKPTEYYINYTPDASEGNVTEFNITVPDYIEATDFIDLHVGLFKIPQEWFDVKAYNDPVMTIELKNGIVTNSGTAVQLFKYRFGSGDGSDITVVDGLTSTSATDALSARQGNVLALITQALTNDIINDRSTLNNHISKVASTTELGHVKIDGTTITIDNGVISAAGGSDIEVIDNLSTQSVTDALSANMGFALFQMYLDAENKTDVVKNDLSTHEGVVASPTTLGHVKIDDATIKINNGVINVSPDVLTTVVDSLNSTSTTDALSANQGYQLEEGLHNLYNDTINISRRVTSAQEDIDNHIPERGTDANFGHVKVDGTTIVSSNGVISAVGLSPAGVVIDNLTSTSATDSLSANQGRVLDGKLVNHSRVVATDTVLGHVMVDDETIKVTSYGEISVDFTRIDQELAMLESEIMQDASRLVGLTNEFDGHVQTKATNTVLGHVMVDGVTIEANNGVISAITPPAPVIVNNLTSTATDESLSANQGRVIKGLIDTATSTLQTQIGRINDNESAIDALETATTTLNNKKTLYYNTSGAVTQQMKVFNAIATVAGNSGLFTVDLTPAAFTSIVSVQMTPINGGASDANAPMAAQVRGLSNTSVGGKAFKASSAGLLAAMQQVVADEGTQIYVTVHGY